MRQSQIISKEAKEILDKALLIKKLSNHYSVSDKAMEDMFETIQLLINVRGFIDTKK